MEAHGVGTDASMATHVSNVIRRGFATLDEASRRLTPAPMGLALVHAMMLIDEGLVLPCVRANIERECARIARGEATFEHVVEHTIAMFRRRFVHFGRHAHRLPSMLAVALAADPFAASGGEQAELGNPGGLAAAAAWRDAARRTAAVDLDGLRDVASARVQAALRGPPTTRAGPPPPRPPGLGGMPGMPDVSDQTAEALAATQAEEEAAAAAEAAAAIAAASAQLQRLGYVKPVAKVGGAGGGGGGGLSLIHI